MKMAQPISIQDSNKAEKKNEGKVTSMVEDQTAKIPSMTWMNLAVGSMAISALLQIFARNKEYGNFVGLWAPCFLLIGIYNKLVKIEEAGRPLKS